MLSPVYNKQIMKLIIYYSNFSSRNLNIKDELFKEKIRNSESRGFVQKNVRGWGGVEGLGEEGQDEKIYVIKLLRFVSY